MQELLLALLRWSRNHPPPPDLTRFSFWSTDQGIVAIVTRKGRKRSYRISKQLAERVKGSLEHMHGPWYQPRQQ